MSTVADTQPNTSLPVVNSTAKEHRLSGGPPANSGRIRLGPPLSRLQAGAVGRHFWDTSPCPVSAINKVCVPGQVSLSLVAVVSFVKLKSLTK